MTNQSLQPPPYKASASDVKQLQRFIMISEIPEAKRTEGQKHVMEKTGILLRNQFTAVVQALTKDQISEILLDDNDLSYEYKEGNYPALYTIFTATCPPPVPNISNPVLVNQALEKLYTAQITVTGVLEEIEPVLAKWLKYERRTQAIVKGLALCKTEWKGESLFEITCDRFIYSKIRELEKWVAKFKLRKSNLERAFEVLSRQITLQIGTPTGTLSRHGITPDNGSSSSKRSPIAFLKKS